MMSYNQMVKNAISDYRTITGLRAYIVYDNTIIESASERNYFCKWLKSSSKALEECEKCTQENYDNARKIEKECIYACHAGLIKWAVPVNWDDFHCVVISEGILAQKQRDEVEKWTDYLSKRYNLNPVQLQENFAYIKTLNEEQVNASIHLLKQLLEYHYAMER